jgi:hypothetical protein
MPWRTDEYNFGTLIRANVEDDYTQENSIFGPSSLLSFPLPWLPLSSTDDDAGEQVTASSSTPSRSRGTGGG